MRIVIQIALSILACSFSIINYCGQREVDQEAAMHFVKLVQKRNYLVHRLEKPIKSLLRFYDNLQKQQNFNVLYFFDYVHHVKQQPISSGLFEQFSHPVVRGYLKEIEQKNDGQAIYKLWSDFLSYKFIESDLLSVKRLLLSCCYIKILFASFDFKQIGF